MTTTPVPETPVLGTGNKFLALAASASEVCGLVSLSGLPVSYFGSVLGLSWLSGYVYSLPLAVAGAVLGLLGFTSVNKQRAANGIVLCILGMFGGIGDWAFNLMWRATIAVCTGRAC